jgi:hypothetical protein
VALFHVGHPAVLGELHLVPISSSAAPARYGEVILAVVIVRRSWLP